MDDCRQRNFLQSLLHAKICLWMESIDMCSFICVSCDMYGNFFGTCHLKYYWHWKRQLAFSVVYKYMCQLDVDDVNWCWRCQLMFSVAYEYVSNGEWRAKTTHCMVASSSWEMQRKWIAPLIITCGKTWVPAAIVVWASRTASEAIKRIRPLFT